MFLADMGRSVAVTVNVSIVIVLALGNAISSTHAKWLAMPYYYCLNSSLYVPSLSFI